MAGDLDVIVGRDPGPLPFRIAIRRVRQRSERRTIERLQELGEMIKQTALCGLGQTAPNPVLSMIRHFRHEWEAHIRD